ncbi:hypothetical protein DESC_500066 [Desulfosarcina cetonica]|nr:hypothetical protein DESC_500066 [Desulfosarcina cetonica]
MNNSPRHSDTWARSVILKRSDGLKIYMADAKRVDPDYGFTQLNHLHKPDIARRYLERLCDGST